MRKLVWIVVLAAVLLPQRGAAWNKPGHRTVAAVAYLNLSTSTRDRVDALLRQHPDFSLLSRNLPPDDPNFGLIVFMNAAEWPDVLRDDPRFFDDTNPNATPTPQLPGFPDMMRHRPWHFIPQGFSTDGTASQSGPPPHALSQILAFQGTLGDAAVPENMQAYNLSWLLHLVGDIHQPLHCISRFSSLHMAGDAGGNLFPLTSGDFNLHSFWDGALTREQTSEALIALARDLTQETVRDPADIAIPSDPIAAVQHWVDESVALSKYVAYTVGQEEPTPIRVRRAYRRLAGKIARHRAVVAGYRLAELLNQRLP